jgi:hypothetical protein
MAKFQVKLGNDWCDYSAQEDKILKRAFMAGFNSAKFHHRRQHYHYDFKNMKQVNQGTGKTRDIRAPRKWKAPSAPIVPKGRTTVVNVPPGSPGTVIQVPYPGKHGQFIAVDVPATARPGQAMLVPVPDESTARPLATPAVAHGTTKTSKSGGGRWSTGAKVAATGAAVVGVGGVAVGGAILGEHIAEHGLDATVDAIGDGLGDVGEAIGDFTVDAGEFVVDAGEHVGDFIMDLF